MQKGSSVENRFGSLGEGSGDLDESLSGGIVSAALVVRCLLTLGLVLICWGARRVQKYLIDRTQLELEDLAAIENESTDVTTQSEEAPTEEEPQLRNRRAPDTGGRGPSSRLAANWDPVDLDESEYIAAAEILNKNSREYIKQGSIEEYLRTKQSMSRLPPPSDMTRERHIAAGISKNFEDLQRLWQSFKTKHVSLEDLGAPPVGKELEHFRPLIHVILKTMAELPETFKNDRASITQCMSISCTAILKYDGLYVLDAIRKADAEIAEECQKIIETAVPFIWAT